MSQAYYYFVASLPMLHWEGKLPTTSEDFLAQCATLLSQADYAFMAALLREDGQEVQSLPSSYQKILEANQNFLNALTAFRAQRAGKDASDYTRGYPFSHPYLNEIFHEAAKQENLLEGQRIIDKAKWEWLDQYSMGHYFDMESLAIYGLKLKILERYAAVESRVGFEIFEEIKNMNLGTDT